MPGCSGKSIHLKHHACQVHIPRVFWDKPWRSLDCLPDYHKLWATCLIAVAFRLLGPSASIESLVDYVEWMLERDWSWEPYKFIILKEGYSIAMKEQDKLRTGATITLLIGPATIIVNPGHLKDKEHVLVVSRNTMYLLRLLKAAFARMAVLILWEISIFSRMLFLLRRMSRRYLLQTWLWVR